MSTSRFKVISCLIMLSCLFAPGLAHGWHDRTHLAISQAAGYACWYNTAAPDVVKTKAEALEAKNHWFSNWADEEVTEAMVLEQANRYDNPRDYEGHLYGAILASLRKYRQGTACDKYAGYHLVFCAHYIGDLSMPLHHVPCNQSGGCNTKCHHARNDGVIEPTVLNSIKSIRNNMYYIDIKDDNDLAREIARLANLSRELAKQLQNRENQDLTPEEAYGQIAHSASLLKAVLRYANKTKPLPATAK